MIPREAEPTLHRLRKGFPVLCITGPRQSGKTTLARIAFPEKPYLSLEDPDIARLARDDPRGLLEGYRDGLVLDEAQYVPEIFSYLKTAVDANPEPGRYVVTGSQQFHLLAGVSESLAGRAAFVRLFPFSMTELASAHAAPTDPFEALVKGFYPPLYDRDVLPYDWYTNYITSYVERDVRSVLNVKDLSQFQTFVRMCAARAGQILNLSALAVDCGLSHNTVKSWLSVLVTSGILYLLPPFHRNFGKRLVKSPKLYFMDTGLASRLLGIRDVEQVFVHPGRGGLFESYVVSEFLKADYNRGRDPGLFFWRDNVGTEIDLVREDGPSTRAFEMKSGKTFFPDFFSGLQTWRRYSGADPSSCSVIYAGDRSLTWNGMSVFPWNDLPPD